MTIQTTPARLPWPTKRLTDLKCSNTAISLLSLSASGVRKSETDNLCSFLTLKLISHPLAVPSLLVLTLSTTINTLIYPRSMLTQLPLTNQTLATALLKLSFQPPAGSYLAISTDRLISESLNQTLLLSRTPLTTLSEDVSTLDSPVSPFITLSKIQFNLYLVNFKICI